MDQQKGRRQGKDGLLRLRKGSPTKGRRARGTAAGDDVLLAQCSCSLPKSRGRGSHWVVGLSPAAEVSSRIVTVEETEPLLTEGKGEAAVVETVGAGGGTAHPPGRGRWGEPQGMGRFGIQPFQEGDGGRSDALPSRHSHPRGTQCTGTPQTRLSQGGPD